MHNSIFILIYLLNISIFYVSNSYAKDYESQLRINPIYKKYSSNSLIKKNSNYITSNKDLDDFCKDYSNVKGEELNLLNFELMKVYRECQKKGWRRMKRYENNKYSNKKSLEQIMIERTEKNREEKERSLQRGKIIQERIENNFDNLFR